MNGVQDRYFQTEAREACFRHWKGGDDSTLLILPTGTGKTVVAGMVARKAIDEFQRRTLFLAHREELIYQAADKIGRFELSCAIEMGDHKARTDAALFGKPDVVIATVQTMQDRRLQSWSPTEFGLIITDEAHHARARSYRNIYQHFQKCWHLGITATPDRGDDKNLGAVYQSMAYEYKLRSAIKDGYLVPLVTSRLMTTVDLKELSTTGGDFSQHELEAKIGPHIEELSDAIVQEIGDRPTVVFTPDVGSAEAMAFAIAHHKECPKPAIAVSGKLPKADRRDRLARLHDGEFQVVCCCDLLTEGWDEPQIACVVVCRPTKKRSRYAQMIGRGTRPDPDSGKRDCLVVDFAWETTAAHELSTVIDLYDDSDLDDEILGCARKLLDEGKECNPEQAIEEAERRAREEFKIRITGRKASYQKFVFDPVGVGNLLGVAMNKAQNFSDHNPATDRQLDYLRNLGIATPDGLSKWGASRMIEALVQRREANKASVKQVAFLTSLGVDPEQARDFTPDQASQAIGRVLAGKVG